MSSLESLLPEREADLSFTTKQRPLEPTGGGARPSLRESVESAVNSYFQHLDGQDARDVYEMVLAEVETPLLEVVMKHCRHNQTRASHVLGLNRGTLRKKLKQYGLL